MPYVPIEWLREHVDVPAGTTAARLAADLVRVGLEEERVVPPPVTGPLVVGRVLTRQAKEQTNGKVISYNGLGHRVHSACFGVLLSKADLYF